MLSDESKEMLMDYKVWALKKFMGKEYMGILRLLILLMKKVKFKKCMIKLKLKL